MTSQTIRERKLRSLLESMFSELEEMETRISFFKLQVNENGMPACKARKYVSMFTNRFILVIKRFNKMLYANKKYFEADYKRAIISKRNKLMIYFESDFAYFYRVEF